MSWLMTFLSLTFGGKNVCNSLTPPGSFLHCREFFSFCLRGHFFFSSRISFLPGPPRLYIVRHVSCLCTHTVTYTPPPTCLHQAKGKDICPPHNVCVWRGGGLRSCIKIHRVDCASRAVSCCCPEEKAAFDLANASCPVTWRLRVTKSKDQGGHLFWDSSVKSSSSQGRLCFGWCALP